MFQLLYRPLLHGSAGPWDEIIFGIGFALSVIIFGVLALSDKWAAKRKERQEANPRNEDREQ